MTEPVRIESEPGADDRSVSADMTEGTDVMTWFGS
jgi:hypothetical protein